MNSLLENPVKMSPLLKELLRSPFTEGRALTSRVSKSLITTTEESTSNSIDNIYLTDYTFVKCADDHFDKIFALVHEARQALRQYRNEINDLKTEIVDMKYRVALESDQNQAEFRPSLQRLKSILQIYTPQNQVDSVYLQQQINNLVRDKQELIENITQSKLKIERMEKQIGTYRLSSDTQRQA